MTMGQLDMGMDKSRAVEPRYKNLAMTLTARLIGCPFWIDMMAAVSRREGMLAVEIENLTEYETSNLFDNIDKLVLRYTTQMTNTPVRVDDDLFNELKMRFTDAQLVELTATIAHENLRARMDHALGIESDGFSL